MWNRAWKVRVESVSTRSTVTNMATMRGFEVMSGNFNVDRTEVAAVMSPGRGDCRSRAHWTACQALLVLGVCVLNASLSMHCT